jgi:hexulose-6-phosphate isomerase
MYAAPQEWIKELGAKICKLHIKGFQVEKVQGKLGGGPGNWCPIDKASIDWKAVRKALHDVHYNGWISVEEGAYNYEEYAQILDRIW